MRWIKVILFCCAMNALSAMASSQVAKVLVFSKTTGYRHKSIPAGILAIQQLGKENNFTVDTTENAANFTFKNLKQYKALIFLSPTGDDLFDENQKKALQKYIRNGGGFVGVHAASDCLFNWEWYGKLVGAYFVDHPKVQEASLKVVDQTHPSTRHLPSLWIHTDEWYNFKDINPDIRRLIILDESSYKGGKNGSDHPISWYHTYEGGRVFYTGLGHTEQAYQDPSFLTHLLGGIRYSMGLQQ